jgi:predicted esterase
MARLLLTVFLLIATVVRAEEGGGTLSEKVAARNDPTQTYTLFLPSAYDGKRELPVLVILDPRGRGTTVAKTFRDGAERYGWILLSSNDTRSDFTGENPNPRAMNALLPDALDRYASDDRRIYLAGFSGTAMLAWSYARWSGKIAGVIDTGGRLIPEIPPASFTFAKYGFAGDMDFNNREMRAVERILDLEGSAPHRFEVFEGDHRWMPPELAADALAWMDVIAMKQKRRPIDDALIDALLARDLEKLHALPAEDRLEALRRERAIVRTFEGLRPVDELQRSIAQLEKDKSVVMALREEARWDAFEAQYLNEVHPGGAAVLKQGNVSEWFRISEMKRRSARKGAEGAAARRILEASYAQLAYYLPTALAAQHRYPESARALTAALEIHDDRWPAWYNLSAAQARSGEKKKALTSLEKAVVHGFHDAAMLEGDEDFASLRKDARFVAIAAGLTR